MNYQRSGWHCATVEAIACIIPMTLGAAHAAAQSNVTLFGIVDGSMVVSRSGAPGATTQKSIMSGVADASFWGVRGVEDLGGGYKALFQLEAGLDLDTGASKTYTGDYANATAAAPNGSAGIGFNRRAHVGIVTPYGTVLVGRDYTPTFYSALVTDTMSLRYFGDVQALLALTSGVERDTRVSNAIFYTSPFISHFRVRAAYSLGSESNGGAPKPPAHGNEFYGVGGDYVSGGLTVSGSYQSLRLPLVAGTPVAYTTLYQRKDGMLGARYVFGRYTVAAGRFQIGLPQRGTSTWFGGSATFGASTVYAQVQQLTQNDTVGAKRRGTPLGIAYAYNLSKRSILYSSFGRTSNNATGRFGIFGNDLSISAGAAGATVTALAMGVRHAF